MALKIRLRQHGRTNRRFYRVVITDGRSPREGKYIESLGWYNPYEEEAEKHLNIDGERARHWLGLGAIPSEKAKALIARAAPDVIKEYTSKQVAHRSKAAQKRKNRKKAKAA